MDVWTNSMVMEFLNLYEQEPGIWNAAHPHYKDRHQVPEAWRRIQRRISFDCSIQELKQKKDNLLSTFRKLVLKIRKSEGTGVPYRPEWFAFDKISSFFSPFYRPRNTIPFALEPNEITVIETSGTVAKDVEKKDQLPIEPTVEIKEEPTDYASNPSTSSNNTNEEFILPHEENSWATSDSVVEPQFTLSVANLSSPNGPETSDGEQSKKKRKPNPTRITSTSTFVPPVKNGPRRTLESPVYNFDEFPMPSSFSNESRGEFPMPSFSKEPRGEYPSPNSFSKEPRGEYPTPNSFSKEPRGEYPTPNSFLKEPRGEISTPGSASKESRKDQFDVFGEYIAAKLRSLDRRSCVFAQKAIGDIIFDAEMGKYLTEGHNRLRSLEAL